MAPQEHSRAGGPPAQVVHVRRNNERRLAAPGGQHHLDGNLGKPWGQRRAQGRKAAVLDLTGRGVDALPAAAAAPPQAAWCPSCRAAGHHGRCRCARYGSRCAAVNSPPAHPPTRYRACLGEQPAAAIRDAPLGQREGHLPGPQQQHALPIIHFLAAAEQPLLVGNPGPARGGGRGQAVALRWACQDSLRWRHSAGSSMRRRPRGARGGCMRLPACACRAHL